MTMSVHRATIQARLDNRLETDPGGRAITFYDQNGNFNWYSYEQFHNKAAGYAAQLAEDGLGIGDVCLIVLPSNEFSAAMILANLLLGSSVVDRSTFDPGEGSFFKSGPGSRSCHWQDAPPNDGRR